ncbi:MAG: hypothetical protein AAGF24_08060, partial [Cyanobacteria bacterium P01_H01_bin.121]
PRTPPFHGGDGDSNSPGGIGLIKPLWNTKFYSGLIYVCFFAAKRFRYAIDYIRMKKKAGFLGRATTGGEFWWNGGVLTHPIKVYFQGSGHDADATLPSMPAA